MNKIFIIGDSFEVLPYRANCIVTSPPYLNGIEYCGKTPPYSSAAEYARWVKRFFALAEASADLIIIYHQRHFEDLVGKKATLTITAKKYFNEYIYVFGECPVDYPRVINARPMPFGTGHPCPFHPSTVGAILEPLPRSYSILDPFAGIGTTLKVAHEMGFSHVVGVEKESEYALKSGLQSVGFTFLDV